MLSLLALQDVPFCVLNTILLDRAVRRRNDPTLLSSQRLCSAEYNVNFLMLLLVLLTSVGMLVYKAMHLLPLPRVWAEHKRLAAEAAEFEECSAAIDRRMGALASEDSGPSASVRLYGTASELEQQRIGNSEPMGDAEVATTTGTAHPSRTQPLDPHASLTHNARRMRMLAATQVDLRCGSTWTATMRLHYRDRLMRGRCTLTVTTGGAVAFSLFFFRKAVLTMEHDLPIRVAGSHQWLSVCT